MISTRRGLELLVALAVILGVLLVLDLRRERPTMDHSLAQGLDADAVTALAWVRPGAPEIQLVREREQWKWVTPVEAIADRGAVANVLATLRAARWHRREPASAAGPTHAVLTISTAMPTTGGKPPEYADLPRRRLAIGAPLPGTEQAWIVDGDDALLVDAWVARALDPDPITLLQRRPLEAAAQAASIRIADSRRVLELEGSPRRLVKPYVVLVRADFVSRLEEALAALEIVELPPAMPAPTPPSDPPSDPLVIDVPSGRFVLGAPCGSDARVKLASPRLTGCVTRDAYREVSAAVDAVSGPGREVMEPRPAPLDATSITLNDGQVLDVTKLRIGDQAVDPVRVAELLAVLSAPAQIADAAPAIKTKGTVVVTDRKGASITIELANGSLIRRPGEALGLYISIPQATVLYRPAAAFRDLTPWVEDALAVRAIRIDDTWSSVRGQVVGEWSNPTKASQLPSAPVEVARALETLATLLAAPGALEPGPSAFATAHRVVIVIAPPAGKFVEHALEVGHKRSTGCPARAAGMSLLLPVSVCDAIGTIAR